MGDFIWQRVIEIAGPEIAEQIRQEFAGERIVIPAKPRMETVLQEDSSLVFNARYEDLKKKYGLCDRTIRRYRKSAKKNGK
jgi:hypothetical protein